MKPLWKYETFRILVRLYYYAFACAVILTGAFTLLKALIEEVGWMGAWGIMLGGVVLYGLCGVLMAEDKKK